MMKRKMMVPVVALLLCVAMVSVGFAAWVITTTTTDTAEGKFTVYNVETRKVDLDVDFTDNSVVFGRPKNYAKADDAWLAFADASDDTEEDLTAKLRLTVKNWTTGTEVGSQLEGNHAFTIVINAVEIKKENSTTSLFDDYVVCPGALTVTVAKDGTWTAKDAAEKAVTEGVNFDKSTGVLTVDLNFGWGEAFNYKNPIAYFNEMDATDDNTLEASAALTKLYELNKETSAYKYALSITADVVVE